MKNYLEMGEPVGSFLLYAFPEKNNEEARKIKASKEVIFQGTRYDIKDKVRLAKKIIPAKKLTGKDGASHTFYFCYKISRYAHQTPLAAMAEAIRRLDEGQKKPNEFFILIKNA